MLLKSLVIELQLGRELFPLLVVPAEWYRLAAEVAPILVLPEFCVDRERLMAELLQPLGRRVDDKVVCSR